MLSFKKIQIYLGVLSFASVLFVLGNTAPVSAATVKSIYKCSRGALVVQDSMSPGLQVPPGSAPMRPLIRCFVDSNNNNLQEISDDYTNPTAEQQATGNTSWAATVTCNNGDPQFDNQFYIYSCSNNVPASVILRPAATGELGEQLAIVNDGNNEKITFEGQESGIVQQCGKGENAVKVRFNFGCVGENYPGESLNPIIDLFFAVIRALSFGVGFLLVLAIIVTGIKYSTAQGDPQAIAKAVAGIRNVITGLLFYFLAFALLQWLVPGGIFNSISTSMESPGSHMATVAYQVEYRGDTLYG